MDSNPSRDDVMAQREAKKLAKLAKKNKSAGDTNLSNAKDGSSKENVSNALNATASKAQNAVSPSKRENAASPSKAQNAASAPVKSHVSPKPNEDAKTGNPVEAVNRTSSVNSLTPESGRVPQSSSEQARAEKSREEILAEREAKKLAKMAAKKKEPPQPGDTTKAVPVVKGPKVKTDLPGDAAVASRISASDKPECGKEQLGSGTTSEKSKAQLRAERREKQEAQRAAKEAAKKEADKTKAPPGAPSSKPVAVKQNASVTSKAPSKPAVQTAKPAKATSYQPKLLSHLQMDTRPLPLHIHQNVHPAIVELGAKYAARVVSGSNARCIAMLHAVKSVIADFVTPREKEFSRAMESRLNDSMAYLNATRPSSVSMTNALKHVKSHLTQLATEKTTTEDEARRKLFDVIDTFIKEQIDVAGEAICNSIAKKISNGDTIAIYGCSSLLLRILVESRSEGKDFEVVVVDGGPLYEGREMCRRLVAENIRCSYVLLPAFSYIVGQTTKVLLGAHALLANGCVMSRSGTALVAMLAKAHNVPVIVCCETYKFCERVQADAFVHNELGPMHGSGSPPLISLMYDMTPPTLVDAVATELAILPCTSVPVILRVKPSDVSSYYY